jgi:hypothetical protein
MDNEQVIEFFGKELTHMADAKISFNGNKKEKRVVFAYNVTWDKEEKRPLALSIFFRTVNILQGRKKKPLRHCVIPYENIISLEDKDGVRTICVKGKKRPIIIDFNTNAENHRQWAFAA